MCAICGIVSFDDRPVDSGTIQRMAGAMRHRGPDEGGVFSNGKVGFGHARLSVIDLAGGHQPMGNPEQSVWITFNGEIFNYIELRQDLVKAGHRFLTASDTEVLLHLYEEEGERCVERLNGQWAFAIWDAREQTLFLSRDRVGVRPLFYTQAANQFLFASEIKGFFGVPEVHLELSPEALDQLFTFWAPLAPRTVFKNIWQLPPGHSLVLRNGNIRVYGYWSLDYIPSRPPDTLDEERCYGEELLRLLSEATRIRLRSDVPVGAYLSGGLDSSTITALAKRLAGNGLKTFSVSFGDTRYDESSYQKEVINAIRTEHRAVHCTGNDIARVFPSVIRHTEQPVLRTAPAPLFLLSKLVRDEGIKVVLTGEGADEVMGGYDIFKETKIRCFWARRPESPWRSLLLKRLYPYMKGMQQQPLPYLRAFFAVNDSPSEPFFSHMPRWNLTRKIKLFFSDDLVSALKGYDALSELMESLPAAYSRWDPFLRAQFLETNYLLPGYILSSQGDRMAMAHSVEGRFPFLDVSLLQFGASLPLRLKMKVLNEKYLLRQCAASLLPKRICSRPKQPYRAPEGGCFWEPAGREYVDDLLSPASVRRSGLFDPPSVERLVAKFRAGAAVGVRDNMALVGIISTQLVVAQFIERSTEWSGDCANISRVEAFRC